VGWGAIGVDGVNGLGLFVLLATGNDSGCGATLGRGAVRVIRLPPSKAASGLITTPASKHQRTCGALLETKQGLEADLWVVRLVGWVRWVRLAARSKEWGTHCHGLMGMPARRAEAEQLGSKVQPNAPTSSKQQAAGSRRQAAGSKRQAASGKRQAASGKQHAASGKRQAASGKQQAASGEAHRRRHHRGFVQHEGLEGLRAGGLGGAVVHHLWDGGVGVGVGGAGGGVIIRGWVE